MSGPASLLCINGLTCFSACMADLQLTELRSGAFILASMAEQTGSDSPVPDYNATTGGYDHDFAEGERMDLAPDDAGLRLFDVPPSVSDCIYDRVLVLADGDGKGTIVNTPVGPCVYTESPLVPLSSLEQIEKLGREHSIKITDTLFGPRTDTPRSRVSERFAALEASILFSYWGARNFTQRLLSTLMILDGSANRNTALEMAVADLTAERDALRDQCVDLVEAKDDSSAAFVRDSSQSSTSPAFQAAERKKLLDEIAELRANAEKASVAFKSAVTDHEAAVQALRKKLVARDEELALVRAQVTFLQEDLSRPVALQNPTALLNYLQSNATLTGFTGRLGYMLECFSRFETAQLDRSLTSIYVYAKDLAESGANPGPQPAPSSGVDRWYDFPDLPYRGPRSPHLLAALAASSDSAAGAAGQGQASGDPFSVGASSSNPVVSSVVPSVSQGPTVTPSRARVDSNVLSATASDGDVQDVEFNHPDGDDETGDVAADGDDDEPEIVAVTPAPTSSSSNSKRGGDGFALPTSKKSRSRSREVEGVAVRICADQTPGYPDYAVLPRAIGEVYKRYSPQDYLALVKSKPWVDMFASRVRALFFADKVFNPPLPDGVLQRVVNFMYRHQRAFWESTHWLPIPVIDESGSTYRDRINRRTSFQRSFKTLFAELADEFPGYMTPHGDRLWFEPGIWVCPVRPCFWIPPDQGSRPESARRSLLELLSDLDAAEPVRVFFAGSRGLETLRESLDPSLYGDFDRTLTSLRSTRAGSKLAETPAPTSGLRHDDVLYLSDGEPAEGALWEAGETGNQAEESESPSSASAVDDGVDDADDGGSAKEVTADDEEDDVEAAQDHDEDYHNDEDSSASS